MKKVKVLITAIFTLLAVTVFADNEKPIQKHQLPKVSQEFINKYFKDFEISFCTKDYDSYDVKFTNGYEIEFNTKGEWKEVDCRKDAIPAAIIPVQVSKYVKQHYAKNYVTKINRDFNKFEVELNNGLDLEIDKNGKLREIDD